MISPISRIIDLLTPKSGDKTAKREKKEEKMFQYEHCRTLHADGGNVLTSSSDVTSPPSPHPSPAAAWQRQVAACRSSETCSGSACSGHVSELDSASLGAERGTGRFPPPNGPPQPPKSTSRCFDFWNCSERRIPKRGGGEGV